MLHITSMQGPNSLERERERRKTYGSNKLYGKIFSSYSIGPYQQNIWPYPIKFWPYALNFLAHPINLLALTHSNLARSLEALIV
jgi:hypothetical protein